MLCEHVLDKPELVSEERFARNVGRINNRQALDGYVQDAVGAFSLADLCALLDKARIAYGRVSTMESLAEHASATMLPVKTPAGPVELLAPPTIVNGERRQLGAVPDIGEHTEALCREFLPAWITRSTRT